MTLVPVSLGLTSSPARYKQGGSAVIINGYAEKVGDEAKSPWHIYASDGLLGFALLTGADGGVRAAVEINNVIYCVAGTRAYKVKATGEVTLIGSMNIATTGLVKMRRNRRSSPDVAIVCGGLMYNIRSDVLTQVTDADLLAPIDLDFVDGYFGIVTANNKWQIGALDDATSWDALDFTRADGDPDDAVAISTMQSQFVIFGETTTEFWRNTGAADFPFERVTVSDVGCLAAGSVQRMDQTVVFVAEDRAVKAFQGYAAERISTHAIERDIESLADRSILTSAQWVRDGHQFYSLTAPGYWTWVYDFTTGLWHKRESYGSDSWRVSTVVTAFDRLIAGDAAEGKLYDMGADYSDEAGEPLVMEIITPPIHAFPYRMRHDALFIDLERGAGTGEGSDEDVSPELTLSWSEDGGETFGNARMIGFGEQGQRNVRVRAHRLGTAPEGGRVYKIQISAKVRRGLYGMSLEATRLGA